MNSRDLSGRELTRQKKKMRVDVFSEINFWILETSHSPHCHCHLRQSICGFLLYPPPAPRRVGGGGKGGGCSCNLGTTWHSAFRSKTWLKLEFVFYVERMKERKRYRWRIERNCECLYNKQQHKLLIRKFSNTGNDLCIHKENIVLLSKYALRVIRCFDVLERWVFALL